VTRLETYTETPEIISRVDSEQTKLILEITLLEVEKEQINLMVNENGCYLSAPSEAAEYVATLSFPSPVNPSDTKATYKDGYLVVEIPFKNPLTDYTKISVE
jgi:HSP20 family molecular chaperone IbpA